MLFLLKGERKTKYEVDPLISTRSKVAISTKKQLENRSDKFKRKQILRSKKGWFSENNSPYNPVGEVQNDIEELLISGLTGTVGKKVSITVNLI